MKHLTGSKRTLVMLFIFWTIIWIAEKVQGIKGTNTMTELTVIVCAILIVGEVGEKKQTTVLNSK